MFFDKVSGFWVESTFKAMAPKVGETRLINCGGPWSCIRVEVVKIEDIGIDRVRVFAEEVK